MKKRMNGGSLPSNDNPMEKLMKELDLVPSTDSLGQTIFVSKDLTAAKFRNEDGSFNLSAPLRGQCAYEECSNASDAETKLKRCTRCWKVDYCSRECQRKDWKRHKQCECKINHMKDKASNVSKEVDSQGSWQSLAYEGKVAMKIYDYERAIDCFTGSMEKDNTTKTAPLMIMLANCYLEMGNATEGLKCAYAACQSDHGNQMTLVTKAKCHLALDDIESAFMSCYSLYNSHHLRQLTAQGDPTQRKHVVPLLQTLTELFVEHIVKSRRRLTEASFPLKIKIVSVPCTFQYVNGQVNIMQDYMGDGFHLCRSRQRDDEVSFPHIQSHTSVSDGSRLVIFGGFDSEADATSNLVRIFQLDQKNPDIYSYSIQLCSGDVPPPTQGHAACIVGRQMLVFGGSADCDCTYTLDLDEWKWTKLSSISDTPEIDRPETNIVFCTLVPLDEESVLLFGGLRSEATRGTGERSNGVIVKQNTENFASNNMHIFSFKTGKWKRLNCSGVLPPQGWGIQGHNIGRRKVLIICGQQDLMGENSLHLLTMDDDGSSEWSRIEENAAGIPPPQSSFRATAWVASANCVLLYGGRYLYSTISDSVLKMKDGEHDSEVQNTFDSELYSFDLDSKQWTRLRVPKHTVQPRSSHTMNALDGKLIVLGGSVIPGGTRGFKDEREYAVDVIRFDLDLPQQKKQQRMSKQSNRTKEKGKRKGKKRR
eukprot:scaffold1275_cov247-Chaetoceros_neogracile.AAC.8